MLLDDLREQVRRTAHADKVRITIAVVIIHLEGFVVFAVLDKQLQRLLGVAPQPQGIANGIR